MSYSEKFDLREISDLPEELRKAIKKPYIRAISEETAKLISLFDIKETMTVDEAMVGLYRIYGLITKKQLLHSKLNHLVHKKILEKIARVTYKKAKQ